MLKTIFTLLFLFCFALIQAQQKPTRFEIYNFDVGDKFHVLTDWEDISATIYTTERKEVLSKIYNTDSSSVTYDIKIQTHKSWNYNIPGGKGDTSFTETKSVTYTDLSNTISHDFYRCDFDSIDSTFFDAQKFNRVIHRFECYGKDYEFLYDYIPGLGGWYGYQEIGFPKSEKRQLVYYKKGNEEWGVPSTVGLTESSYSSQFTITPNPASTHVNLSFSYPTSGQISISDMSGKEVLSQDIVDKQNLILDITSIEATGLYIVKLKTENDVMVCRFVLE